MARWLMAEAHRGSALCPKWPLANRATYTQLSNESCGARECGCERRAGPQEPAEAEAGSLLAAGVRARAAFAANGHKDCFEGQKMD